MYLSDQSILTCCWQLLIGYALHSYNSCCCVRCASVSIGQHSSVHSFPSQAAYWCLLFISYFVRIYWSLADFGQIIKFGKFTLKCWYLSNLCIQYMKNMSGPICCGIPDVTDAHGAICLVGDHACNDSVQLTIHSYIYGSIWHSGCVCLNITNTPYYYLDIPYE